MDGVDSDISSELGDIGFEKDKNKMGNFMGSEDSGVIDMNYFSGGGGGGGDVEDK